MKSSIKKEMWDRDFKDRYILIEPTDLCNLDCIMCSRALMGIDTPHNTAPGFMDIEIFKKIVDDIQVGTKPIAIKLFWLGESVLHPRFMEMIDYLYEKIRDTNAYIDLHTNATLLTMELIDRLVEIGNKIPRITFSIDAATHETYEKIRVKGDFEKTIRNIKYFVSRREWSFSEFPKFIFQFIVMKENAHEIKKFVEYWKKYLDETRADKLAEVWPELRDQRKKELLTKFNIYDEWNALEKEKQELLKCLEN